MPPAARSNKLDEPASPVAKLKDIGAVAIGFVDGDLELIWQRQAAAGHKRPFISNHPNRKSP